MMTRTPAPKLAGHLTLSAMRHEKTRKYSLKWTLRAHIKHVRYRVTHLALCLLREAREK